MRSIRCWLTWAIRTAKLALDEITQRLQFTEERDPKTSRRNMEAVGELEPSFHRSLRKFGPEFESLEFTSSRRMTEEIHKILGRSE